MSRQMKSGQHVTPPGQWHSGSPGRTTRKWLLVAFAVAACSTIAPLPTSAERFAELYGGTTLTERQDLTINGNKFYDIDFDTSVSLGGRIGYWSEPPRSAIMAIGLALDVSHFRPDISSQTAVVVSGPTQFADIDLSVTAISLELMVRLFKSEMLGLPLLESEEFPQGRVHPYLMVGPAIFIAEADDTTNFGPPSNQSDSGIFFGLKAGTGLAWQLHKNFALFGEYQFMHFRPRFNFGLSTTAEWHINTHHFVVGASFRF